MLAQGTYDADYIADCRGQVEAEIAAFDIARSDSDVDDTALDDLEVSYFGALVLALELRFVHRLRAKEGKDGNALNEVRLIAQSLMSNGGRMVEDPKIALDPQRSVLHVRPGDDIVVRYDDFVRLARAFFAEIEARYVEG